MQYSPIVFTNLTIFKHTSPYLISTKFSINSRSLPFLSFHNPASYTSAETFLQVVFLEINMNVKLFRFSMKFLFYKVFHFQRLRRHTCTFVRILYPPWKSTGNIFFPVLRFNPGEKYASHCPEFRTNAALFAPSCIPLPAARIR